MHLTILNSSLVWVIGGLVVHTISTIYLIGSRVSFPLHSFGCVSDWFRTNAMSSISLTGVSMSTVAGNRVDISLWGSLFFYS